MDIRKEELISRLQDNLSAIRKIAGWTTEDLGGKIGVTKQTVSNLENKKTPMTLTQYIAIRAVLDFEIQTNKENIILARAIDMILNENETYTEEERKEGIKKIHVIAATAAGGITGVGLMSVGASILGGPILGAIATAVGVTSWMPLISSGKKPKKPKDK